jgi:hypothetical protein
MMVAVGLASATAAGFLGLLTVTAADPRTGLPPSVAVASATPVASSWPCASAAPVALSALSASATRAAFRSAVVRAWGLARRPGLLAAAAGIESLAGALAVMVHPALAVMVHPALAPVLAGNALFAPHVLTRGAP